MNFLPKVFPPSEFFSGIFHLRFTSGRQQTCFLFTTLEAFFPESPTPIHTFRSLCLSALRTFKLELKSCGKFFRLRTVSGKLWKTLGVRTSIVVGMLTTWQGLRRCGKFRRRFFSSPLAARLPSAHRSHAGDRKTRKMLP
jgi:hypothetical protein